MLEDILRDTWFYQKILKKGYEMGREEERQQRLQRWHELLVGCVEAIFPLLSPWLEDALKQLAILTLYRI